MQPRRREVSSGDDELHSKPAHAVPLASARQHPEKPMVVSGGETAHILEGQAYSIFSWQLNNNDENDEDPTRSNSYPPPRAPNTPVGKFI